mmetsp:Transcript_35871/g.57193  ORF Transcript_35871/g.57193 Transcript_35871/m.57193 type:complete len:517 (-) Transcript_35871:2779-4329(-)
MLAFCSDRYKYQNQPNSQNKQKNNTRTPTGNDNTWSLKGIHKQQTMSYEIAGGPRHWTKEEDNLLKDAVDRLGARHWKIIARYVPRRTHTQCLQRWNKVLKPGLLKGPWSAEEDHLLRNLVEQSLASLGISSTMELPRERKLASTESTDSIMSTGSTVSLLSYEGENTDGIPPIKRIDWVLIAENIVGRSVKQCRERWCSNLDPAIKKGVWTAEEDRLLMHTQNTNGNCWAHIARLLPGRTEHAVKTRFRSIMRAKKREWSSEEDQKLIEQYKTVGSQWAKIAECFNGKRTKNAIMTRFKQLQSLGLVSNIQAPRRGRQQQLTRAPIPVSKPQPSDSTNANWSQPKIKGAISMLIENVPNENQNQQNWTREIDANKPTMSETNNAPFRTFDSAGVETDSLFKDEASFFPSSSKYRQPPQQQNDYWTSEQTNTDTMREGILSLLDIDQPTDAFNNIPHVQHHATAAPPQTHHHHEGFSHTKRRRLQNYPSFCSTGSNSVGLLHNLEAYQFGTNQKCN